MDTSADPGNDPFETGLPTIEGPTTRLRAFEARDREAVFELYRDRDAVRFGYAPKMETVEDADRLIDEIREIAKRREVFHWGVAETSTDAIIGHATLFEWKRSHRRAEIGYSIRRDRWGHGVGTEAVGVLLHFAFERLDLRRIEADVDPRNLASLRVLEKLGFVREGYARERWELAGEIQDGILFGLLRREWNRPHTARAESRGGDG